MKRLLLTIFSILIIPPVAMYTYYINSPAKLAANNPLPPSATTAKILGTSTTNNEPLFFTVSIPATFKEEISAPNVIYSLDEGRGIDVTLGQDPTITNTGVLSLQDKTGALEFEAGGGISIDDLKISNSGVTSLQDQTGALSLTAGTGVTISGLTLTNSNLGSSQNIFKTLSVAGQSDIVVDTNSDTLTLVGSGGVTITTDATTDQITITSAAVDLTQSGWTTGTGTIYLTTLADKVGIGTASPSVALDVVGAITASNTITGNTIVVDNLTLDAATIISDTGAISFNDENLTTTGSLTTNSIITTTVGSNLIPIDNITYDLGSSEKYWKDLYLSGNTIYFDDITDAGLGFDASDDKFTFDIDGTQQASLDNSGNLALVGNLTVSGGNASFTTLNSGDSNSYSFVQTDWSGGVGVTATHSNNRTSWNQYSAKGDITASTELSIDLTESYTANTTINFTTEGSYTQEDATNGTDFDSGIAKLHSTSYTLPTKNTIDGDFSGAQFVYATDVDGDGNVDVLGTSSSYENDNIVWWQNDGAASPTFTKNTLDESFSNGAKSIYAIDVDDDEDLDILGAGDNTIAWYENDGNENFTKNAIDESFTQAYSVYATDVDGDGDVDILGAAKSADDIVWYENDGAVNPTFTKNTIDGDLNAAYSVYATDVDGDGDVDVLGASNYVGEIVWYESDGAVDPTFTKNTIDGDFGGGYSVYATDVDGDGDVDVLGAAFDIDDIVWYENDGAVDPTFTKNTIDGDFDGTQSVYATDVDGDGDVDVLGAAYNAGDITWYENDGAVDPTFTKNTIDGDFSGATSVYAADVDGDGNVDVLGTATIANDIAWWKGVPGAYASNPYYLTTTDTSQINASSWEHIHSVDLTQTTPASTSINYLVSFDDRSTWKYFNTSSGEWTSSSLANLQTEGMTKTELEAITRSQWEATGGFDSASTTVLDFATDLYTTDTSVTPELDLITVNYQYPATISETLTSSVFDTEATITQLNSLSWTETISAGTSDVKFQIRTSADNSTWTSWYGPGCSSSAYYSDNTGGDTICTTNTDRINDRYFQIKVWLTTTDSSVNPTLSDVTLSYVQLSPLTINSQYSQPTYIGSGNPYYSFGAGDLFVSSDLEIGTGVIYSDVANGASAVSFTLGTYNTLSTAGAKLLSVQNAETEKFAVDKDGNITVVGTVDGIDVSAIPTTYLALAGDTMTGDLIFNDSVSIKLGTGNDLTLVHGGTNSTITSTTGNLIIDNTNATGNSYFQLGTDTTTTAFQILNNTGTELLEIDGSGNVGIGTADSSSKLHVSGAVTGNALFTLNETGDQALLTASASSITKFSILHNGLVNATVGGLATYTKAGTIDDTDFTDTAVDGLMGFDSTNGRLYIRNSGAWSYIAKTAGFQIPDYESEGLSEGDFLIPYVEKKMEDGALHGLYSKFSDVKGLLFTEENAQIASISSQLATIQPIDSSAITAINDNINQNASLITTVQTTISELTDKISSLFSQVTDIIARLTKIENQTQAGTAIIPTYGSDVSIIFDPAFEETPTITVTIDNPNATFGIKDKNPTDFIIYLTSPTDQDLLFSWIAIATGSANVTVGNIASPSATPISSSSPEPTLTPTPSPTATPSPSLEPSPTTEN